MGSLFKKVKSLAKNGIDPLIEGKHNYKEGYCDTEELALERSIQCERCPNFVEEPIDIFEVVDERLPQLSKMMCDDCGCAIPYLLRQSKKICVRWDR